MLGLANAGADTVNSIKQAAEFGVNNSMKLAALLMFITDVHALGLATAQGLNLTESFYWDLNDRTRAFTNRVKDKTPNNWPNMVHAGCYSATLHYLKTVADMGAAAIEYARVRAEMPELVDLDEDAQIREVQGGILNFYSNDTANPYVALVARGPWIVTLKGAVLYDSGGYGMLGFAHTPADVLDVMARPQAMANVMTPNLAQLRFADLVHLLGLLARRDVEHEAD